MRNLKEAARWAALRREYFYSILRRGMTTGSCNFVRQQRECKPKSRRCQHIGQIDRAARSSGRDGEEALEVSAFGEADGVVDGGAGAVDLSQGPARLRRRSTNARSARHRSLTTSDCPTVEPCASEAHPVHCLVGDHSAL